MKALQSFTPVSRYDLKQIKGGGKPVPAGCPDAPCSIIFDCPFSSCYCAGAAGICISTGSTNTR